MIDILLYKVIHLLGIMMLFTALGGLMLYAANGGTKAENRWRSGAAITHGVGMLLILVAGFGMLARLGIIWPWPGWVIAKFVIWLVFGGLPVLIYKKADLGKILWWGALVLGVTAAYLALYKPF